MVDGTAGGDRAVATGDDARRRAVRDHLAEGGPYEIRHGDVWLRGEGAHIADGNGMMAVSRDGDMLMKHGEASKVRAHAKKAQDRFAAAGLTPDDPDSPRIEVIEFPITPQTIAELNACVACTGRVAAIEDNLQRVTDYDPADAWAKRHGDPMNPVRIVVTRKEVEAALGAVGEGRPTSDDTALRLVAVAHAVRQPGYVDDGSGSRPDGTTARGVAGMAALSNGFGAGRFRTLHVDAAHARSLPGGKEAMAALAAASLERNREIETPKAQASRKETGRDAGR